MAKYHRFFNGHYYLDEDTTVEITTLVNPDGFVAKSSKGTILTITIDDALDFLYDHRDPRTYDLKSIQSVKTSYKQGNSPDSVAAQISFTALNQLYNLLGVKTQTDAVQKLEKIFGLIVTLRGEF